MDVNRLSSDEMKSLFDPAIDTIVELVESQVAQARNEKQKPINVGGKW